MLSIRSIRTVPVNDRIAVYFQKMAPMTSVVFCLALIFGVFILSADGHCGCRRKHSKKHKCPPESEEAQSSTSLSTISPPPYPCNCNPEKCLNMMRRAEFCYCFQNDSLHHVSHQSLPTSRNCSELNVPCAKFCVNLFESYFSCDLPSSLGSQPPCDERVNGCIVSPSIPPQIDNSLLLCTTSTSTSTSTTTSTKVSSRTGPDGGIIE